jgi:HdeA/HdeB family
MSHLSVLKYFWIVIFLGAMAPTMAHAQVAINMSRITCADYLAMTPEQSNVFGAWLSGYFNQKTGYTWIDLAAQRRNVESVRSWCAGNPKEFVMAGLTRATETAGYHGDPDKAPVKLEMTQITCREFIDYPFDRAEAIGA